MSMMVYFDGDIDQACHADEQGERGVAGETGLPGPLGPKVKHHHLQTEDIEYILYDQISVKNKLLQRGCYNSKNDI